MKGTCSIFAAIVVIAVTVSFEAEGFPRPQENMDPNDFSPADGFVFDGPADRTGRPSTGPGAFRTTTTAAPGFPSRPTVGPTQPPIIPSQPPVPIPTPAPGIPSPEVVQCARNCPVTPEYNPVCGSDGIMYNNPGHLTCTRNCGINVTQLFFGRCTSNVRG